MLHKLHETRRCSSPSPRRIPSWVAQAENISSEINNKTFRFLFLIRTRSSTSNNMRFDIRLSCQTIVALNICMLKFNFNFRVCMSICFKVFCPFFLRTRGVDKFNLDVSRWERSKSFEIKRLDACFYLWLRERDKKCRFSITRQRHVEIYLRLFSFSNHANVLCVLSREMLPSFRLATEENNFASVVYNMRNQRHKFQAERESFKRFSFRSLMNLWSINPLERNCRVNK